MRVLKKTQLSRPTMAELMLLVKLPNTVTQLSKIQGVTRQRITELGESCEQKGLITRTKRGRFVHFEITGVGSRTIADLRALLS